MQTINLSERHDVAGGAIAIDWVVLTAAVVGLAVAAYSVIENNTESLAGAGANAISTESGFGD